MGNLKVNLEFEKIYILEYSNLKITNCTITKFTKDDYTLLKNNNICLKFNLKRNGFYHLDNTNTRMVFIYNDSFIPKGIAYEFNKIKEILTPHLREINIDEILV